MGLLKKNKKKTKQNKKKKKKNEFTASEIGIIVTPQ